MKRPWAVIVAAAVLVGCRNSQPATNPFLRTTVSPPATGAVVVAPGELYTPPPVAGAPVAGAPAVVTPAPPAQVIPAAPPAVTQPPPAMPPRDPRYVPPGGTFQYHQSSNDRGKTLDLSALEDDPSVADVGESPQPAAKQVAQASPKGKVIAATHQEPVVEPSVEEKSADAAAEPADAVADGETEVEDSKNGLRIVGTRSVPFEAPVEEESETTSRASPVMHLVAGGSARGEGASSSAFKEASRTPEAAPEETAPSEDRVAQAAKLSLKNASGGVGSVNAEAPDYAFGPDYTWLRGRLEYSQTARSWKLRYIPIDGQTDSYGGSVVLADSPALAAFKPGDTVSARGALAGASPHSGSFSPLYQLQQIEPVVR